MVGIEAIGTCLGSQTVTNAMLRKTYPLWDFDRLEARTGVFSRPIAAQGETALDFAERAARFLISNGTLQPDLIGGLIFCTETPDHIIPPNSAILHQRLNLSKTTAAFDITLACSGFTYALMLARGMIETGVADKVMIATADTYSRLVHPGDRATRTLFGDGGAVSIISRDCNVYRILGSEFGTAGQHYKRFMVPAGGARIPFSAETRKEHEDKSGNIRNDESITMDGFGVLSFFNTQAPFSIRSLLAKHKLTIDEIDLFICHQASKVALEGIRKSLGVSDDRFVIDIQDIGNLVSASIPVAIARAKAAGRIKPHDKIILCGFGVGLSWGTVLIEA